MSMRLAGKKKLTLNEPVMEPHTEARKQSRCAADQTFGDFPCSIATSALVLARTSVCIFLCASSIILLSTVQQTPKDRISDQQEIMQSRGSMQTTVQHCRKLDGPHKLSNIVGQTREGMRQGSEIQDGSMPPSLGSHACLGRTEEDCSESAQEEVRRNFWRAEPHSRLANGTADSTGTLEKILRSCGYSQPN